MAGEYQCGISNHQSQPSAGGVAWRISASYRQLASAAVSNVYLMAALSGENACNIMAAAYHQRQRQLNQQYLGSNNGGGILASMAASAAGVA